MTVTSDQEGAVYMAARWVADDDLRICIACTSAEVGGAGSGGRLISAAEAILAVSRGGAQP